MKRVWSCRRTFLATIGIMALTLLGYKMDSTDVALAIAGIVGGVAAANGWEAVKKKAEPNEQP